MEDRQPQSPDFIGSVRALGDGLLAGVEDRLKLVSAELREEKLRLVQTLIWIGAVFLTGTMAVAFASLTLVFLFWESARLAVLGGLTALYIGALAYSIVAFRRHIARQPDPLEATLQEIKADRACIRSAN